MTETTPRETQPLTKAQQTALTHALIDARANTPVTVRVRRVIHQHSCRRCLKIIPPGKKDRQCKECLETPNPTPAEEAGIIPIVEL